MTSDIRAVDSPESRTADKPKQKPIPAAGRPKDAATLILVDRSGSTPKVLLGKRHASHKFMPGKFVFPGGRVDPADKLMPVASPLDSRAEARLMRRVSRPSHTKPRALA